MASYLLSWWYGSSTHNVNESEADLGQTTQDQVGAGQAIPRLTVILPDAEDPPGDTGETSQSMTPQPPSDGLEEHDDTPPAFPSLDSIQRSRPEQRNGNGHNRKDEKRPDTELMPPPSTIPVRTQMSPPDLPSIPLIAEPNLDIRLSYTASLRIPAPSTTKKRSSPSSSLLPPPTTMRPPPALSKAKRGKVMLAPGHSPLDWAALKASGTDLRGTSGLVRVTPSILGQHKAVDDAWTAINGRVYNITPYLDYHPGGVKELMRVAGRDGSKLFASTHAWVNVEFMLDECLVGFLVPEGSVRVESSDEE